MNMLDNSTMTKTRKKEMGKKKKKSKVKQVMYMVISIVIMVFILYQGYYLVKYTLGYEVDAGNLIIYKWINKVEQKEPIDDYTNKNSTTQK